MRVREWRWNVVIMMRGVVSNTGNEFKEGAKMENAAPGTKTRDDVGDFQIMRAAHHIYPIMSQPHHQSPCLSSSKTSEYKREMQVLLKQRNIKYQQCSAYCTRRFFIIYRKWRLAANEWYSELCGGGGNIARREACVQRDVISEMKIISN